jgi:paraquat-inducible protein A
VPFPPDLRGLRGRHVPVLLAAALLCLVAGLTLPIMEVSNLWVFRGSYSIVDGIVVLIEQGDIFIAAVIAVFSVLLPAAKILGLLVLWRRVGQGRHLSSRLPAVLEAIGKWSMLDVFVVALIVFAAKASMLADANVAPAVIPFVASIVLTIYCSRSIKGELAATNH